MDPISASGIALAVVSLAGQCFTGAMTGLELITSARNLKPEYKYLTIRLQLEKQRCFNWASQSGLLAFVENNRDPRFLSSNLTGLNRNVVLETIAQIEALVVGFIKYQGRYAPLVSDSEPLGQAGPSTSLTARAIEENRENQAPAASRSDVRAFLARVRGTVTSTDLPKRIRWAAMDKDKYEELINKLKAFNDSLLDLMDDRIRTAIYQSTQETRLSVLQLNSRVEDLSQLIKALLSTPANAPQSPESQLPSRHSLGMIDYPQGGVSTELLDQIRGSDDRQLVELAKFKVVNASIEEEGSLDESIANELDITQPLKQIQDTTLKRRHIKIYETMGDANSSARTEAEYRLPGQPPQRVWIEWKEFTPIDRQLSPNPTILDRVQKLTALLRNPNKPASLHVPSCIGYFNDAEPHSSIQQNHMEIDDDDADDRGPECRFGFVFSQPKTATMHSLWDILGSSPRPSLTKRIALAQALSSSVLSLHVVNWLHKGLRSANILFVKEHGSSIDISDPYVSGFDYARPAQKGEMTEMPALRPEHSLYRHPDAHNAHMGESWGFRKTFDIYSLGVVLVEIACWQRIESVLGINDLRRTSPKIIMQRLVNESATIDAVDGGAGSRFAMATRACLEGRTAFGLRADDDEADDAVGAKLATEFYEKVLRCLENITT